ncbi:MAG: rhomboid family intramembrane serine protease [Syntrophotaleaceae bacterium]
MTDPIDIKTGDSSSGQDQWTELPPVLSRSRARLAALVLESCGIPFGLERKGRAWQLSVPPAERERALFELEQYERENRNWPPPPPEPEPHHQNTLLTLSILGLLGIFHNLTWLSLESFGFASINWTELGNADAGKILEGQWWRAITSLTLHADGLHLLGNLVIGGFFIDRLCREIGAGWGWALVVVSGLLGNVANALLQPDWHRAVGASTAVFGAVGILASRSALRHRRHLLKRWLLPVSAALALLGLLGTGGENTDIGAHLLGFLAGLLLGWPASRLKGDSKLNALAGIGAALLTAGAWLAALEMW